MEPEIIIKRMVGKCSSSVTDSIGSTMQSCFLFQIPKYLKFGYRRALKSDYWTEKQSLSGHLKNDLFSRNYYQYRAYIGIEKYCFTKRRR